MEKQKMKCIKCEDEMTTAEKNFMKDFGAVYICKHKEELV